MFLYEERIFLIIMFKLKMEVDYLKKIFTGMGNIISEANMEVNKNGLIIAEPDDGLKVVIGLYLSKTDFDEFVCDKKTIIGLPIFDVVKILSRANRTDSITMEYNGEDDRNHIHIMFKAEKGRSKRYKLNLTSVKELRGNVNAIMEMKFSSSIKIPYNIFNDAIEDCSIYGEEFTIKVNNKRVDFSCDSVLGDMNSIIEANENITIDIDEKKEEVCLFGIDLFKTILKTKVTNDDLFLELEKDKPIKITIHILENSKLVFVIAPRVSEEDDYDEE